MRLRLLPLALVIAAVLALPAAAPAKPIVGISENQPLLFSDPLFTALNVKHVRVVVSYNAVTRSGDDEIARVTDYLNRAQAAGITPLVSFEHSRGDASGCNKRANRNLPQCALPTAAEYERNIREFLARFPFVKVISPWNEINHFTQATARNPRAAANFTKIVERNCADCTIIAADILDQADSTKARRPTFKSTARYIRNFKRAYRKRLNICGIHNYSDTNRFRDTGTKAIVKALGCRQIWLTETGGIYKFASFKASQSRQLRATKYMFTVANRIKKIKRVYVYTWFGGVTPRFDAGLVANGQPRSAYNEVKRRV